MTRFNLVVLLTALSLSYPATATASYWPDHPSCDAIKAHVDHVMNTVRCNVTHNPMIISGGQCHAEVITTDQDYPRRIYGKRNNNHTTQHVLSFRSVRQQFS